MPEDATPASADTTLTNEGDGGEGTDEQSSGTLLTAAEVEEQWRNRMSQRDKAHNAETETLRRQLADHQATEDRRRREIEQQRLASMSETDRVAAERDALQRQLEEERNLRVVETRKARFPAAAAELGDEVLAAVDEGKLASLNARLATAQTTVPPSLIDPNSAARANNGSPLPGSREKTVEDLKADLERYGPEFAKDLRG